VPVKKVATKQTSKTPVSPLPSSPADAGHNSDLTPSGFQALSVFALPSYGLKNYQQDGETKANLMGGNFLSFGVELVWALSSSWNLRWYNKLNQVEYEPNPKSDFPFQPNVKTRTWIHHLMASSESNAWGYGLWIGDLPTLRRQSFEQVTIEQQWAYGVMIERSDELWTAEWTGTLALIGANHKWGLSTSQRILFPLLFDSLRMGGELEAVSMTGDGAVHQQLDLYWILGWQF
jgi:hypothetical protein